MTTLLAEEPAQQIKTPAQFDTWSAAPTPLTASGTIDVAAVRRSIDHHVALGCEGIMLAGTCGEGPWLSHADYEVLVRTGVEHAAGRLAIAVQATDNSPALVLERAGKLAQWGAETILMAQPFFFLNATPERQKAFYLEIWDNSPLPVSFYDRGSYASVPVPVEILEDIVSHPRVVGVKDSSSLPERFAAMKAVRDRRPELRLRSGNEFGLMTALESGYDGAFFGGMVLTARAVQETARLYAAGDQAGAAALDEQTKAFLFDVYGGPKISCWLSGLKYALVQLGLFSEWTNVLQYPLTPECREAIDKALQEIKWIRPENQA